MIKKLFNYDSKGKLREWTIEVEGGKYRTIHGLVGGKIQTTLWNVVQETNVGRSNHRDVSEQALFEAQATITKQKEQGWRESIEELSSVPKNFECMLADSYTDRAKELNFSEGIYVQPKLDGIRLNVVDGEFLSRNKKPFVSIPHLNFLRDFSIKHNVVLDGELYNHEFKEDFNKITSLVKKTKPTDSDLKESEEKIFFYIYDAYFKNNPDLKFTDRFDALKELFKVENVDTSRIVFVLTYHCNSPEVVDAYYGEFLEKGYEGQMVRVNVPYQQKRGRYLLKRKEFYDAEYEIVEIGEGRGNRSGTAGYAIMKNKDGSTFSSNIKGNREWIKDLLINKESVVGKMATIKYLNLTPDGVPRFPFLMCIRDYE
jgi:DNA ligase-1